MLSNIPSESPFWFGEDVDETTIQVILSLCKLYVFIHPLIAW